MDALRMPVASVLMVSAKRIACKFLHIGFKQIVFVAGIQIEYFTPKLNGNSCLDIWQTRFYVTALMEVIVDRVAYANALG